MTLFEFKSEMHPFLTTFGETNYPAHRTEMIWEEVKELDVADFRRIVKTFIGEFKPSMGPKVSAFREHAETSKKNSRDRKNFKAYNEPKFDEPSALVTFSSKEKALESVREFYRLMVSEGPAPEWIRKEFREYGAICMPHLSQQVDWFKKQVESGSEEARFEYVVHAKKLILDLVQRAIFDGTRLKHQYELATKPKPQAAPTEGNSSETDSTL